MCQIDHDEPTQFLKKKCIANMLYNMLPITYIQYIFSFPPLLTNVYMACEGQYEM